MLDNNVKEVAISKFGWGEKENSLAKIIIDGNSDFDKNTWFPISSEVILYYYVHL
jgi:hypothetical protein